MVGTQSPISILESLSEGFKQKREAPLERELLIKVFAYSDRILFEYATPAYVTIARISGYLPFHGLIKKDNNITVRYCSAHLLKE